MLTAKKPYHHGALREALLDAAERILDRDGIQGLTLRGTAREAGASHAAPKNHFDDLTGLLSELAAVGFTRFAARLRAASDADPGARFAAAGQAYVAFAADHPGLFQLMFRGERLDGSRPALKAAMEQAFGVLSGGVGADGIEATVRIASAWSLVHGFAMLMLDGQLPPILSRLPAGTDTMTLLGWMLGRSKPG